MSKAIALKKTDKLLGEILDRSNQEAKHFSEKMMFIRKQTEQANEAYKKSMAVIWLELIDRLKALDLLPPEYQENDCISYDPGSEVVYWHSNVDEPSSLEKLVKSIFRIDT